MYLKELCRDYPDFHSLVHIWSTKQLAPAQIFDDVVMAATEGCSCFLVNTGEGLLLFDALLPIDTCRDNIVSACASAGWEIRDLKQIFITHGHFDHTGVVARLARETGARVAFPEEDFEMWRSDWNVKRTNGRIRESNSDVPPVVPDLKPDRMLRDGDVFTLGHTTVRCVATPGHTRGCMTYLFTVTEQGTPHLAMMPGGTLPQKTPEEIDTQMRSLAHLEALTDELGIDVELQNHHPLICGAARMEVCRSRLRHVPNPFLVGREGVHASLQAYRDLCLVFRERLQAAQGA